MAQIIFAISARALEGLLTIDASQKSSCSFHWKYLAGLRNLDEAAAAAVSRRHSKPIPSIIPTIIPKIIPIKILYKISIETHTNI